MRILITRIPLPGSNASLPIPRRFLNRALQI
jgi:hypothetical protein